MRYLLHLTLSLFYISSLAQTPQTGWVTSLNSNKTPLAGVQITFYGAADKTTDIAGNFKLTFRGKSLGDLIVYEEIYKKGYEIVNIKELQTAKLSKQKLKIILCKAGLIAQKQVEYYNISVKAITAGHERQIKELKKQLDASKIAEEQFVMQQRKLMEEKEAAIKYANELAEQFARTNFDDVSDLYKRAFEQFQLGNIDKAIEIMNEKDLISAANALINDKQTTDSLKTLLAVREQDNLLHRDTLMQTIQLKVELLVMQLEYEKADTLYQQLWLLDTTHVENTFNYANYLRNRKQYEIALMFCDKLLRMEIEDWRRGSVCNFKGTIYHETGRFSNALVTYTEFFNLYKELHKQNKYNYFYTENLAISYQNLGNIYKAQGDFVKALEFYTFFNQLGKELSESNPKCERMKNSLAISYEKLGGIYESQGNFVMAMKYYTLDIDLTKELYKTNPKSESLKNGLAISYSKIGRIYELQDDLVNALEYYALDVNLTKELYESNPKSESLKYGLAISYQNLGSIYKSQGNLVKSLECHTHQLALFKELYEANPKNESLKNGLAISYSKLGAISELQGDLVKALEYYTLDAGLAKQLYEFNPKSESLKNSLAISYSKLGGIYESQGNFVKALEYYTLYNKFKKELYESNPNSLDLHSGLGMSYYKLALVSKAMGKKKKVIAYYENAAEIFESIYKSTGVDKYKNWAGFMKSEIKKIK